MIRILASAAIGLLANAIGLIVAANVLDGMGLGVAGFITALLVFTAATVLLEPLVRQMAIKNAPAILGSSALIAVLFGLIVAVVVGDSLTIDGAVTWVLATVIIWAVSLAGRLLLPLVIFKKVLAESSRRG